MSAGRKPLPTNLRVVGGNAGHRALPKDEPKPELKIPDPPVELRKECLPYWKHYAKLLLGMRVLSEVDQMALAMLADCTEQYWHYDGKVKSEGIVVAIGKNKTAQYNPHWVAKNKCGAEVKKLLTEFGLTPSSRTRVRVE